MSVLAGRSIGLCCAFLLFFVPVSYAQTDSASAIDRTVPTVVAQMLGEELKYDVSFLWFKRLAEGTISLMPGPEDGQYTALLQARTLGLTAFLTSHRVEKIETVMEFGPEGLLRPLIQRAYNIRGEGKKKKERIRSYHFDHQQRQVYYKNWKTGKKPQEKTYPMDKPGPVYDLLSAFYNVRAGLYGPVERGRQLALPTFTRRGTEDVIVERLQKKAQKRQRFFPKTDILCKVLADPDTFGTKGRDVFVGFDTAMVPQRAVVKNVIGLGDVRGVLRSASNLLQNKHSSKDEDL